jgi:hypothetical protein
MSTLVHAPFAGVLRSARADFNARFVEMKRRHPDLDAEAFSAVLRTMVDPIADAVSAVNSDRLGATVWAAYDAALVVVAEKLAGPGGRYPAIAKAWQELLPAVAQLVATSPFRVIGAVTNALTQLASTPSVREAEWTARLLAVAPELTTVDDFLRAGQVAAWRCGLAHYRDGALAAADHLLPAVALRLLDAPAGAAWPEVCARLRKERWWDPAQETAAEPLRVVRSAGTFRGFGGLFIEPPTVAAIGGQIFVRSGDSHWLVTADAFGATFHRADAAEFEAAAREKRPPPLGLAGAMRDLPALGKVTSTAETADTVAVTGTLTHSITLLAIS